MTTSPQDPENNPVNGSAFRPTSASGDESFMPDGVSSFRRCGVVVDEQHSRAHNEMLQDRRRLQVGAAVLAVGSAAIAGFALLGDRSALTVTLGIVFVLLAVLWVAVGLVIGRVTGNVQRTFDSSELVPAIVVEVRPHGATVMALVDAAVDRSLGRQEALALRRVQGIDGRKPAVGDRLPAAAVAGLRHRHAHNNRYDMISPAPLGWVTGDAAEIRRAARSIPEEEWRRLEGLQDRWREVATTPDDLLVL